MVFCWKIHPRLMTVKRRAVPCNQRFFFYNFPATQTKVWPGIRVKATLHLPETWHVLRTAKFKLWDNSNFAVQKSLQVSVRCRVAFTPLAWTVVKQKACSRWSRLGPNYPFFIGNQFIFSSFWTKINPRDRGCPCWPSFGHFRPCCGPRWSWLGPKYSFFYWESYHI